MSPQGDEREAREQIDRLLTAAGWSVCDADQANLAAHRGVAIREFPLPGQGFADYLLYVDQKAAGVIEAKKAGSTLTGVETQSARYTSGLPKELPAWERPLPFAYESTGIETRFTNALDPKPRSRPVFAFHQPQMLASWLEAPAAATIADSQGRYSQAGRTFLARLQHMPELIEDGLWPAQVVAIHKLEQSLRDNRPRALIQMATETKTYRKPAGERESSRQANVTFDGTKLLFPNDRTRVEPLEQARLHAKQTLSLIHI